MKKKLALLLTLALTVSALAACGQKNDTPAASGSSASGASSSTTAEKETLKVGASSTPHAEILEQVKDALAEKGYDLEIVVYDDYVLPNKALADGDLTPTTSSTPPI